MKLLQVEHQRLASCYRMQLSDPVKLIKKGEQIEDNTNCVFELESRWNRIEEFRALSNPLPENKKDFLYWYQRKEKELNSKICGFLKYLANDASIEQIAYYICMEEMVDGSFDDLMAMVQVGMNLRCKMVAGSNYWDEMGRGNFSDVHTSMFKDSADILRPYIQKNKISPSAIPPECYSNGNMLLMWALRRQYNIRLVGAMGLIEGSAPTRFAATTMAMQRLNLPSKAIAYHESHIMIDTHHSKAWLENVLDEYLNYSQDVIKELSLGVQIRFNVALDCYKTIESEFALI
ncbi:MULTISPECIES: iron-containing redox enzyme family protein [Pseudomonas]|uniref:Iron-containing redox enzyme family protein n=1 Tax=Pseudomonas quercus TaxID=2722792 RepID=A0ABX0YG85_9PSED|nr:MULTISPECIES: iron-containing redox enzyme family protein [Pseudomonas]MBF7143064.1 iron-containing redox enzyme family protein [Pseudomonas sp. LY10J]NJP01907.1 iron-containing redox enzyme family protein [Pseudomonas quercus]